MILLDVAVKTLREMVREPKNLGLTLGLPVTFMLIFGLAFGGSSETTYQLAAVNDDQGELGARYLDGLRALERTDGAPLVELVVLDDLDEARKGIEKRTYDLLVHVPAGFTRELTPSSGSPGATPLDQGEPPAPPRGTRVTLEGDPGRASFAAALQVVRSYNQAFAEEASGRAPLVATMTRTIAADELTQFDHIAPGLMVFAMLNMAPQAASTLAREVETRTLDRVRLSPARAGAVLGGVSAAHTLLAAVSVGLMLGTAELMGFHNQGSFAAAYLIALVAAVSVLGLGMLIASVASTQSEAANLGAIIAVPASFLSGAFFPVPGLDLFEVGDVTVGLYDLLPTTHAVNAMTAAMTFGDAVGSQTGPILAAAVMGAALYGAGVVLFKRNRMGVE